VPATVAKTTETVTSLPTAETVKQKPAEEEEDTSNVNDHGHQGIVSDITHSLSTHHIVQEEDLGRSMFALGKVSTGHLKFKYFQALIHGTRLPSRCRT